MSVQYLRERWRQAALMGVFAAVYAVLFALYRLPLAAVLYPTVICLVIGAAALGVSCRNAAKRHEERLSLLQIPGTTDLFVLRLEAEGGSLAAALADEAVLGCLNTVSFNLNL